MAMDTLATVELTEGLRRVGKSSSLMLVGPDWAPSTRIFFIIINSWHFELETDQFRPYVRLNKNTGG